MRHDRPAQAQRHAQDGPRCHDADHQADDGELATEVLGPLAGGGDGRLDARHTGLNRVFHRAEQPFEQDHGVQGIHDVANDLHRIPALGCEYHREDHRGRGHPGHETQTHPEPYLS